MAPRLIILNGPNLNPRTSEPHSWGATTFAAIEVS
jgi:hypothetical protein